MAYTGEEDEIAILGEATVDWIILLSLSIFPPGPSGMQMANNEDGKIFWTRDIDLALSLFLSRRKESVLWLDQIVQIIHFFKFSFSLSPFWTSLL